MHRIFSKFIVDNEISDEGASKIAIFLKQNSTLKSLNLGCMHTNTHIHLLLTNFDIDNKIGDEGASQIANSLQQNSKLTYLNLDCTHIT